MVDTADLKSADLGRAGSSPAPGTTFNNMIEFAPTKDIKKRFSKINFKTLSVVFTLIFDGISNHTRTTKYTIRLRKSTGECCFYRFKPGKTVWINISETVKKENEFLKLLVHEFRHFIQDKLFKLELTRNNYDESTLKSYKESPVEIDANYFVFTFSPIVIRMYNKFNKTKDNFKIIGKYKGKKI
jgi:hypothetical protein